MGFFEDILKILWYSMRILESSRILGDSLRIPWDSMRILGDSLRIPWDSMRILGILGIL